jgi:hypothetical protein
VGLLAALAGPMLLEDHPLPWRVASVGEQYHVLDKNDALVMPFEQRVHAERFVAFNYPNSLEAEKESKYQADNARFQANWVEENSGLAAILYGVPSLPRR